MNHATPAMNRYITVPHWITTLRLRGADAIYVVTARLINVPILTLDNEQLTKGASVITTVRT